jgi:hypothetical protein
VHLLHQGQAQALFAQCLVRDLVAEPQQLLSLLFSTVDASRERAVIRLVGALLKEGAVEPLIAPFNPVVLLMERFVVAQSPSLECSMALEVLAQVRD